MHEQEALTVMLLPGYVTYALAVIGRMGRLFYVLSLPGPKQWALHLILFFRAALAQSADYMLLGHLSRSVTTTQGDKKRAAQSPVRAATGRISPQGYGRKAKR